MGIFESLKSVWKKLGIRGHVINYSSKRLWVIETDSGKPIARWLKPGFKTPAAIDVDGFKRADGKAIDGHANWWKFYDVSNVEVCDQGKSLKVSAISRTAVGEAHFGDPQYIKENWGSPIQVIIDVRRNTKGKITSYFITGIGWVDFDRALRMTCYHEIANARPVFPKMSRPYIRTRRDKKTFNNLSSKATV